MLLNNKWVRYLVIVLVAGGLGAIAALELRPLPPATVVEKRVEGKKETVVVERVVTKTVKPDGTVTETTTEKAKSQVVDTRKSERKEKTAVFRPKTTYSLDLRYLPAISEPPSFRHMDVTIGRRLGDSNTWVTAGYDVKHGQVTLGLRYEL